MLVAGIGQEPFMLGNSEGRSRRPRILNLRHDVQKIGPPAASAALLYITVNLPSLMGKSHNIIRFS
jgi:hypothetical protein